MNSASSTRLRPEWSLSNTRFLCKTHHSLLVLGNAGHHCSTTLGASHSNVTSKRHKNAKNVQMWTGIRTLVCVRRGESGNQSLSIPDLCWDVDTSLCHSIRVHGDQARCASIGLGVLDKLSSKQLHKLRPTNNEDSLYFLLIKPN